MLQIGGWQNKKNDEWAHRRQSMTAINNRIYIKTREFDEFRTEQAVCQ